MSNLVWYYVSDGENRRAYVQMTENEANRVKEFEDVRACEESEPPVNDIKYRTFILPAEMLEEMLDDEA